MNLHTSDKRHRASSRASRDEGVTELQRSAWPQLPCLGRGRTGDASTGPWPSWPRTRDHDMHNPGVRVSGVPGALVDDVMFMGAAVVYPDSCRCVSVCGFALLLQSPLDSRQ